MQYVTQDELVEDTQTNNNPKELKLEVEGTDGINTQEGQDPSPKSDINQSPVKPITSPQLFQQSLDLLISNNSEELLPPEVENDSRSRTLSYKSQEQNNESEIESKHRSENFKKQLPIISEDITIIESNLVDQKLEHNCKQKSQISHLNVMSESSELEQVLDFQKLRVKDQFQVFEQNDRLKLDSLVQMSSVEKTNIEFQAHSDNLEVKLEVCEGAEQDKTNLQEQGKVIERQLIDEKLEDYDQAIQQDKIKVLEYEHFEQNQQEQNQLEQNQRNIQAQIQIVKDQMLNQQFDEIGELNEAVEYEKLNLQEQGVKLDKIEQNQRIIQQQGQVIEDKMLDEEFKDFEGAVEQNKIDFKVLGQINQEQIDQNCKIIQDQQFNDFKVKETSEQNESYIKVQGQVKLDNNLEREFEQYQDVVQQVIINIKDQKKVMEGQMLDGEFDDFEEAVEQDKTNIQEQEKVIQDYMQDDEFDDFEEAVEQDKYNIKDQGKVKEDQMLDDDAGEQHKVVIQVQGTVIQDQMLDEEFDDFGDAVEQHKVNIQEQGKVIQDQMLDEEFDDFEEAVEQDKTNIQEKDQLEQNYMGQNQRNLLEQTREFEVQYDNAIIQKSRVEEDQMLDDEFDDFEQAEEQDSSNIKSNINKNEQQLAFSHKDEMQGDSDEFDDFTEADQNSTNDTDHINQQQQSHQPSHDDDNAYNLNAKDQGYVKQLFDSMASKHPRNIINLPEDGSISIKQIVQQQESQYIENIKRSPLQSELKLEDIKPTRFETWLNYLPRKHLMKQMNLLELELKVWNTNASQVDIKTFDTPSTQQEIQFTFIDSTQKIGMNGSLTNLNISIDKSSPPKSVQSTKTISSLDNFLDSLPNYSYLLEKSQQVK